MSHDQKNRAAVRLSRSVLSRTTELLSVVTILGTSLGPPSRTAGALITPSMCLLAFRLWPAHDCAQGRGLRCAAGPDGLASSSLSRLADKPMEEELAPGPLRFAALAGRDLQCQKAKRRAASTASAHNPER
jgi:hypothetical protein